MATFKGRPLSVGDTVLIEIGYTFYERKIVATSEDHIKLNKEASFIKDWCNVGRVKDVLTPEEAGWEDMGDIPDGVKEAGKPTRWQKVKRRFGWE